MTYEGETIRCDVVSGEQEDVSNSQHQRWSDQSGRGHRELGEKSKEKEKRGDQSALCSSTRSAERGTDEDVSNSSSERQLHRESGNLGEESRETQGARENDTQGIKDTSARGEPKVCFQLLQLKIQTRQRKDYERIVRTI